tara:strand:+ start:575 stop:823 length:249 start_codon:yes stop_codon:yes gene_type:complete
MEYHITKDGTEIKLSDLELSHLKNILRWIDRKADKGLTIRRGGGGFDVDSWWYCEDTYYGEDARIELNYYSYKSELSRREIF